jgi:hypothetical protein
MIPVSVDAKNVSKQSHPATNVVSALGVLNCGRKYGKNGKQESPVQCERPTLVTAGRLVLGKIIYMLSKVRGTCQICNDVSWKSI